MTKSDVFTQNRHSIVRKDFLLQMGRPSHFQGLFFSNIKRRPAPTGSGEGLTVLLFPWQNGNLCPESR